MNDLITSNKFKPNTALLNYPYSLQLNANNNKEYFDLDILKLGLTFLLTCIIRDKEKFLLVSLLK